MCIKSQQDTNLCGYKETNENCQLSQKGEDMGILSGDKCRRKIIERLIF